MNFIRTILAGIWNFLGTMFTGGKFGASVESKYRHNYGKYQEQRRKEFEKFGTHLCKICSTKIPGNKAYCGACYYKYKKS